MSSVTHSPPIYESNQSINGSLYDALSASNWVSTDRLNAATGQNFTSWGEFFGPHQYNGDYFTTVQRENITSSVFDNAALGIDIQGASIPAISPQLYSPENIIILSDGLCSSTCGLFVEMMHHEAGVKTVVVGGLPQSGPMQTAGGSRGAEIYIARNIDNIVAAAENLNATTVDYLPNREIDVLITFLSVNLRDQVRKEQQDVPVQFVYDAADCRIFYTAETWSDYSSLWSHAVNAISDPKLCVAGSTGYSLTGTGLQASSSPPTSKPPVNGALGTSNQFTNIFSGQRIDSFVPKQRVNSGPTRAVSQTCNNHGNGCPYGRCSFKSTQGQGSFNGRTITFRLGTCPAQTGSSSGVIGLITKNNEPAEIRGEGGRKRIGSVSSIAKAVIEQYGSGGAW